jgi:hypothetical protein
LFAQRFLDALGKHPGKKAAFAFQRGLLFLIHVQALKINSAQEARDQVDLEKRARNFAGFYPKEAARSADRL